MSMRLIINSVFIFHIDGSFVSVILTKYSCRRLYFTYVTLCTGLMIRYRANVNRSRGSALWCSIRKSFWVVVVRFGRIRNIQIN